MRSIFAAAMILLLAMPAFAQSSQSKSQTPGPPPPPPKSKQEIDAERKADQDYKKSLGNIPDQPPADPWGNARGTDAPKTGTKTTAVKKPTKTGGTAN
jgi:hypothetical protein